ncbi:MAG: hypothetical protein ACW96U_13305 [Candidatus Heimdallarchaeaceae archaeon]|jgi:hypothetical protein
MNTMKRKRNKNTQIVRYLDIIGMLRKVQSKLISVMIISTMILPVFQISADSDHLITRIVDADYPPRIRIDEEWNYTRFGFDIVYQIENPTQSDITIVYFSDPYPFPRLTTNLENKSLSVQQAFILETISGESIIHPGIKNETYIFYFEVDNYLNENLPVGRYDLWLDYTNTSVSPVPVVTEKLIIRVTRTNITYFFEYSEENRIVSTLQTTDYQFSFLFICLSLVIIYSVNKKKREK